MIFVPEGHLTLGGSMVGGIIDSVYEYTDRTTIIVRDMGGEASELLELLVEPTQKSGATLLRTALLLRKGDTLWWQDRIAYWTPADKAFQDVPIERLGYSFRVGDTRGEVALSQATIAMGNCYAHK